MKTRLAHAVGNPKALEVYEELLQLTKSITSKLGVEKIVYWDQLPEHTELYFGNEFSHAIQSTGDLGIKMASAFQNEFSNEKGKILIIGTDCPYLKPSLFEEAYDALDLTDFVIGPAIDGGYYLLGMKEYHPFVFENIPWSTDSVLPLTLQTIQSKKFTYSLLVTLNDIDTEDDWKEWKRNR
ncbi:TIGR04282 family arsenosugar biosynthesis glycosyltransferase [Leptospira kemamanensis]|uniref:TIGR04282 family arsenosugar biosynthesis glycosyltransferase n=1 Tax=Leptospira kemamanensis TaxID=2484942 RepID=UPI0031345455